MLLIRRRRPIAEPAGDASTLAGTAGAGRTVLALAELGIETGELDQLLVDPGASETEIDHLEPAAKDSLVALGSHLVNRPETPVRAALIRLAVRHLEVGGRVLIEHHPVDWAEAAESTQAIPGGAPGMVDVVRHPPFVSAVSVYDAGGRELRQPFTARVLSESELAAALVPAGLIVSRRLGATWLEAIERSGL